MNERCVLLACTVVIGLLQSLLLLMVFLPGCRLYEDLKGNGAS